ncbi:hypothetical protein AVEN_234335-1 [Araneus ventricosus]|uniref:Uncharacterized protein n=1 Tax=Araneus ventricosus TaxID=182803 RepID=A0A4Y2A842_ARAVE|nr:hypothetical protein AVEN_234335-1 [Araneus ventricosus]
MTIQPVQLLSRHQAREHRAAFCTSDDSSLVRRSSTLMVIFPLISSLFETVCPHSYISSSSFPPSSAQPITATSAPYWLRERCILNLLVNSECCGSDGGNKLFRDVCCLSSVL